MAKQSSFRRYTNLSFHFDSLLLLQLELDKANLQLSRLLEHRKVWDIALDVDEEPPGVIV